MSPPIPAAPRWKLAAAFASIYFIWGSTFLAIRFAVETVPPLLMAASRFLSAGAILYAALRLGGEPAPRRRDWRPAFLIGGLLFLAGNGGVSWSERRVPSALVALMIATIPLWMTLLEWLGHGGPKPTPLTALGLGAGFAGTALLVNPASIGNGAHVDPLSALVLMVSAVSWAAGSLYARRAGLAESPLMATAMQLLAGGALLVAAGLVRGEWAELDLPSVTVKSVLSIAYLSVFGSIITFSAYVWLLRVTPAARVSTYAYVNPPVAVLLGWALGGETVTPRTLVATGVIVGAVVIITFARTHPAPAGAPTRRAGDVADADAGPGGA